MMIVFIKRDRFFHGQAEVLLPARHSLNTLNGPEQNGIDRNTGRLNAIGKALR